MTDEESPVKTFWTTMVLAVGFVLVPLGAQEAPYVSRLTAQPGPTSVLLTWKDPAGWEGESYEVWRSDQEIVKDTLAQAQRIAAVPRGTEAFEDTAVPRPSFYLVLVKDASGNLQKYFIPYRNKTTEAVGPQAAAPALTARIKMGPVEYANPQIVLSFRADPADRRLVVFRKAGPFGSFADLKDATVLGQTTGAQGPWKDTPSPGLEFYYAVVDAQAFADGQSEALTPDNVTDSPAGFPLVKVTADPSVSVDPKLRPGTAPGSRTLPLPRLRVAEEPDSGAPLVAPGYEPVAPQPLPAAARSALTKWSTPAASVPVRLPALQVLPEERSAVQTGAGRYLVQIQKAYLDPQDWKGAQGALEAVLKLPLDSRTESRARYYLGEALAFQKDYKQAFVEFLAARNDYPAETKPFLEGLLSLLGATKG